MRFVLAICAACVLGTATAASAEWHFTPMIGATFRANTSLVDLDRETQKPHANVGGAVAVLGAGIIGAEGIVVFTPSLFGSGGGLVKSSRSVALMGNVVVAAPKRYTEYSLRPFVSSGIGLLTAHGTDTLDLFAPDVNVLGMNVGGGAIGFLTKSTGIRLDLRYYSNLQHFESFGLPQHLRYMTFSFGVVIRK